MENISVKFILEGVILMIQCKKNDYMIDIFKKFAGKVDKDINSIYFLYDGDMINKEAQLSKYIKEDKEIVILVVELNEEIKQFLKISKDIICPGCKEICVLNFKDYKISLNNCKYNHFFSNILFDQFNDFQTINESKIKCNICNNNKKDTYNNQFYKCCNCNFNICPTCKLSHENNHKILDYDQKNIIAINMVKNAFYIVMIVMRIYVSYVNHLISIKNIKKLLLMQYLKMEEIILIN